MSDTDDVRDLIDGALHDHTVSNDAMRSVPPEARSELRRPPEVIVGTLRNAVVRVGPVGADPHNPWMWRDLTPHVLSIDIASMHVDVIPHPGFPSGQALMLTPDALARIGQRIAEPFEALSVGMRRVGDHIHMTMEPVRRAFGPHVRGSVADEAAEDPRERALRLRRERNTGPARDPHRHRGI